MSRQRTTSAQRAALVSGIRADISSGRLGPGDVLPSLRALAAQYGVPRSTVQIDLEPLIDDGLIEARPGAGLYVARSAAGDSGGSFLFVARPGAMVEQYKAGLVRQGFERRITAAGGHTAFITLDQIRPGLVDEIPDFAGTFWFVAEPTEAGAELLGAAPSVEFGYSAGESSRNGPARDCVHFNDHAGGVQATRYLLGQGLSRIAFMSVHRRGAKDLSRWSFEREAGWRSTMLTAMPDAPLLAFRPSAQDTGLELTYDEAAQRVATQMLQFRDCFDGVVAADDAVALGLVTVWKEAKAPASEWPSIVGFEDFPQARDYVLTSLVVSWERLGEVAAELLQARRTGALRGPSAERSVPLHLSARLTSYGAGPGGR